MTHYKRKKRDTGGNALQDAVQRRDRDILTTVRDALVHKDVLLAYQPVHSAAAPNRIAFFEGLARVMDPTGRIVPARDFMPYIEEIETGRLMDCVALDLGLRALVRDPALRLSINMSARSIGYREWMNTLDQVLDRHPTVAERLILEITESSAMTVPELVADFMRDLRARGVSFAIDDFGAGHTALRYFRQFQFDILKIDGQFARNISQDADNQVLTAAMISIAQHFDMYTVAEHVESAEDAACLIRLGVDCLQGYHYGAPSLTPPWETDTNERIAV